MFIDGNWKSKQKGGRDNPKLDSHDTALCLGYLAAINCDDVSPEEPLLFYSTGFGSMLML